MRANDAVYIPELIFPKKRDFVDDEEICIV